VVVESYCGRTRLQWSGNKGKRNLIIIFFAQINFFSLNNVRRNIAEMMVWWLAQLGISLCHEVYVQFFVYVKLFGMRIYWLSQTRPGRYENIS